MRSGVTLYLDVPSSPPRNGGPCVSIFTLFTFTLSRVFLTSSPLLLTYTLALLSFYLLDILHIARIRFGLS